jgi:hypothetical protein
LHSSHITEWRKAAEAGATMALGPKILDRREREVEQLRVRTEEVRPSSPARERRWTLGKAHALLETEVCSANSSTAGLITAAAASACPCSRRALYVVLDIYSRYVVA